MGEGKERVEAALPSGTVKGGRVTLVIDFPVEVGIQPTYHSPHSPRLRRQKSRVSCMRQCPITRRILVP